MYDQNWMQTSWFHWVKRQLMALRLLWVWEFMRIYAQENESIHLSPLQQVLSIFTKQRHPAPIIVTLGYVDHFDVWDPILAWINMVGSHVLSCLKTKCVSQSVFMFMCCHCFLISYCSSEQSQVTLILFPSPLANFQEFKQSEVSTRSSCSQEEAFPERNLSLSMS